MIFEIHHHCLDRQHLIKIHLSSCQISGLKYNVASHKCKEYCPPFQNSQSPGKIANNCKIINKPLLSVWPKMPSSKSWFNMYNVTPHSGRLCVKALFKLVITVAEILACYIDMAMMYIVHGTITQIR